MRTVLLAFLAVCAAQAQTLVSQANSGALMATPVTVTLGTNAPAYSVIVIGVGFSAAGKAVTGITGGGVTWTKAVSSAVRLDSEIWYSISSAQVNSGTVFSIAYSGGGTTGAANMANFSGLAPASILGQTGSNNGTAAGATSASVSSFRNTSVVFGCYTGTAVVTSGPSNSFNALTTGNQAAACAYRFVPPGSYSTTWTRGLTLAFETEIAVFHGPAPLGNASIQ